MEFTQSDWNHLHDVVLNVTGKSRRNEELEIIFSKLPAETQALAKNWGMNDTPFRDAVAEYLRNTLTVVPGDIVRYQTKYGSIIYVQVKKLDGIFFTSTNHSHRYNLKNILNIVNL